MTPLRVITLFSGYDSQFSILNSQFTRHTTPARSRQDACIEDIKSSTNSFFMD